MSVDVESSRASSGREFGMMEGDSSLLVNGSSNFNDIAMTDAPAIHKPIFDPHIPVNSLASEQEPSVVTSDVEMEDLPVAVLDPAPREDMDMQIRRLQAELFREESKLILLKKMYQLQNPSPKADKKPEDPPLERKGQPAGKSNPATHSLHQNGIKGNSKASSDMRNDKLLSRDAKSVLKGGPANNSQRSSVINQPGSLGVAELTRSLAQKTLYKNAPSQNASGQGVHNSRNASHHNSQNKQQVNPADQLEQQLSSERLNLKRQMEKTVLQVTPPKPPLPDINFVPATVCPDFIALLGMELSANYAIHSKNLIDQSPYLEPYLCAKCGEDVCPAWKIDKDSGIVVCEPCFVGARSSAARASHIENLRKAFATVLEKGKDLDRQHTSALAEAKASRPSSKSVSASASVFPTGNSSSRLHTSSQQNNSSPYRSSGGSPSKSPASSYSRSALPPAPSSRKAPLTSPFAQMSAPQPFAPSSAIQKHSQTFGNPALGIQIRHSQDAQRQYLLDLISRTPKPTQQQQQSNHWRK